MFNFLSKSYNNSKDSDNLLQGRNLLINDQKITEKASSHLDLISRIQFGSVIEAIDGDDSTQNKNKVNVKKVSKKDDRFNRTLVLYSKNYAPSRI